MASNLLDAGYSMTVFTRTRSSAERARITLVFEGFRGSAARSRRPGHEKALQPGPSPLAGMGGSRQWLSTEQPTSKRSKKMKLTSKIAMSLALGVIDTGGVVDDVAEGGEALTFNFFQGHNRETLRHIENRGRGSQGVDPVGL